MITGAQIRMARGYLKWSVQQLAMEADLGLSTIRRMEAVDGVPPVSAKSLHVVQCVLEDTGIVFITENGSGPGVKLKTRLAGDRRRSN